MCTFCFLANTLREGSFNQSKVESTEADEDCSSELEEAVTDLAMGHVVTPVTVVLCSHFHLLFPFYAQCFCIPIAKVVPACFAQAYPHSCNTDDICAYVSVGTKTAQKNISNHSRRGNYTWNQLRSFHSGGTSRFELCITSCAGVHD